MRPDEATRTTAVIVDRIEGNWAVLELEDGATFEFPLDLLPAGCQEGQAFRIRIERDRRLEQARLEQAAEIQRRLLERD